MRNNTTNTTTTANNSNGDEEPVIIQIPLEEEEFFGAFEADEMEDKLYEMLKCAIIYGERFTKREKGDYFFFYETLIKFLRIERQSFDAAWQIKLAS